MRPFWFDLQIGKGTGHMSIRYKMDVLKSLKTAGYTSYRLRQEKIMGERVIQQLRSMELVSWNSIDKICALLACQPGDLMEYVPGSEDER